MNRRDLFKNGFLGGVAAILGIGSKSHSQNSKTAKSEGLEPQPKYIVNVANDKELAQRLSIDDWEKVMEEMRGVMRKDDWRI